MYSSKINQNQVLFVISAIAIVNALGYGIIIPILYPYSQKFGLNDFQNGLLFSAFSLAQLLSTPIIGRLSDKYGRKPLLVISLLGTFLSFIIAAFAQNAIWLFCARILDGITAGNIPVAQAVISDSTDSKNRSKGFGIIGASFGFGFIFGPAISALTVSYGANIPFLVAALVTFISILLTIIVLPETNKNIGQIHNKSFFNFKALYKAFIDYQTKHSFWIIFLYSVAFSLFIYAFQPLANKGLKLNTQLVAYVFTASGIMGVLSQIIVLPRIVKKFGDKKGLIYSIILTIFSFSAFIIVNNFWALVIITMINALFYNPIAPLSQSLLSKNVDAKSQGSILGLSASAMAIGQIIGPIIGGTISTFDTRLPFPLAALLIFACYFFVKSIPTSIVHKESSF